MPFCNPRLLMICLLLACCPLSAIVAQVPGYKIFKPGEAGSPGKIFTLAKNKQGYLLAGCADGLYKFDGRRFKKIDTAQRADTVTAIFEDAAGLIWVGYQSGKLALVQNNQLRYLQPEEGTPQKKITAFTQDLEGNIWIATNGEGIYYFKNKRLYLLNDVEGLSDLNVHALALSRQGQIIAATDNGISICNIGGNKKKVSVIGPRQGLPDYIVTSIAPAGNNLFWVGLQDKGFCLYNHQTGQITTPAAAANWGKGQVNTLLASHGNIWIATQDSGLLAYNPASGLLRPLAALNNQQKSVTALIDDKDGGLWLVADNSALIHTAGNSLQLLPLYSQQLYSTIHTILADKQQAIWVGTDMAVIRYSHRNGNVEAKKIKLQGLDIKTDITTLYQDVQGNIWIGTMGKGIYILDAATGRHRQLTEAAAAGNASILSITGNGHTVCAAGLEGALIFELTPANTNISSTYHFTSYNNIQKIGSTYIYHVFKDSKQRIWFATDGKGLTMLQQGQFTHYDDKDGIADNHIYAVTEDGQGKIWFSTSNAGLYCFDGNTMHNYTLRDGLSNLSVAAVKTVAQGQIAVTHPAGIDLINPVTGTISYINAASGFGEVSTDLGAVCTDSAGNLYTATPAGILIYTPLVASNQPSTRIETVQLFLTETDTAAPHLFAYDENNFTFNFNALYYPDPTGIFYQYRLDGLDTSWQLTSDNSKSFPKLPPGKYIFRVRSSLNKNFSHATEAAYAFTIQKPFWKQWWFVVLAAGSGTALLYWFIKLREQRVQHVERLKQEKIEFEFQVLRNQVNPHFLFNSFNTLISTIEEDPAIAVQYVEQLSDFFRNIVTYRDKDLISLHEELQLLNTYLYLQQKRYGSYLQLHVQVPHQLQEQIYLPPLTLQLLMENAIKHNAVSKESTLAIYISLQQHYLVVTNNTNPKSSTEKSTGMGLQNIINRYALLTDKKVQVQNSSTHFTVSLPIIKNG
jgi:ligand-binding sensor domain-containing protein